jgi:hypothetical protein
MAQQSPVRTKVNTKNTTGPGSLRQILAGSRRPARGAARVRGDARESARGRLVMELDAGDYRVPAGAGAAGLGRGRPFCEAATAAKLAVKLAKVIERLEADAPGMRRPGADLIAW